MPPPCFQLQSPSPAVSSPAVHSLTLFCCPGHTRRSDIDDEPCRRSRLTDISTQPRRIDSVSTGVGLIDSACPGASYDELLLLLLLLLGDRSIALHATVCGQHRCRCLCTRQGSGQPAQVQLRVNPLKFLSSQKKRENKSWLKILMMHFDLSFKALLGQL